MCLKHNNHRDKGVAMAEISLGQVTLTEKQLERLSEAHSVDVKGFRYKGGELIVNHAQGSLNDSDKAAILSAVQSIPNDDTDDMKEEKTIRSKKLNDLTVRDLAKILRRKGLI